MFQAADEGRFQDVLAAGGDGLRVFELEGSRGLGGWNPTCNGRKRLWARSGVSGGTSPQDGQCAKGAGADVLK